MEMDARRLYLGESLSSLFTYCTQGLHLSEHAAYNRIEAARVARRFPIIVELIAEGAVTLTAVKLLAPHLTVENHGEVLGRARHKNKHDVERLVASLHPQPDAPVIVRKLPMPAATSSQPLTVPAAHLQLDMESASASCQAVRADVVASTEWGTANDDSIG